LNSRPWAGKAGALLLEPDLIFIFKGVIKYIYVYI
jgi:hypothetical protein